MYRKPLKATKRYAEFPRSRPLTEMQSFAILTGWVQPCDSCGEVFESKRPARLCGDACRAQAYRDRKKGEYRL